MHPPKENISPHNECQAFSKKSCAANRTLYITTSPFSFHFRTKTHLYPTGLTPSNVRKISPKISRFSSEVSFSWIASFHFCESVLYLHSLTDFGSKNYHLVGWFQQQTVHHNIILIPPFSSLDLTYWDFLLLIIFIYLDILYGLIICYVSELFFWEISSMIRSSWSFVPFLFLRFFILWINWPTTF